MVLIFSDDFDSLPIEPKARWLKLRDLLEKRLNQSSDPSEGFSNDDLVEYCSVLSAAAEELGVGKLGAINVGDIRRDYETFRSDVAALATRLSLQVVSVSSAMSVSIKPPTKEKIYAQIERLRSLISSSSMPSGQQATLQEKLDELHILVAAPRTDFGRVLLALGVVASIVMGGTSFLADAPNAVGTITGLIGAAKEEEDTERLQIEKEKERLQLPHYSNGSSLDDEIPF